MIGKAGSNPIPNVSPTPAAKKAAIAGAAAGVAAGSVLGPIAGAAAATAVKVAGDTLNVKNINSGKEPVTTKFNFVEKAADKVIESHKEVYNKVSNFVKDIDIKDAALLTASPMLFLLNKAMEE